MREINALLTMETRQLLSAVESDLAELRRQETARLLAYARDLLEQHPNPRSAAVEIDQKVKTSLQDSIESWRLGEEEKVAAGFRQATQRFSTETDHLVRRTIELCSDLLEITLSFTTSPNPSDVASEFTYAFFEVPGSIEADIEAIRRRLPATAARRIILRRLERKVPELVDKHCGRLRWDFAQRLDQTRDALSRQLDERLDATIDSLRRGIERAQARKTSVDLGATSIETQPQHAGERLEVAARELAEVVQTAAR